MSIAIIFGGKSCEHDVSVVTGVQLLNAVKKLNPFPIYIDREGVWRTGRELFDVSAVKKSQRLKRIYPHPGDNGVYNARGKRITTLDVAVLCCHGAGGEDGCLQGLLELCGVPYTGSGVLESALCMNKAEFKRVAKAEGFPTAPYTVFTRKEFNENIYAVADRLNSIGYPFIIKPSNLGSSIGIGVARTEAELVEVTRDAFAFDNTVVAEKLLTSFRELNCAALGDERGVTISEVEEPIGWKEFLSFEDKYAGGGKELSRRRLPAEIPDDVAEKVRALTEKAFRAFSLSGVVRIDYMLTANGELYLNEINTLPGSMASYFFRRLGMRETDLVEKLADVALYRHKQKARLTYSYTSPVLGSKG